MKIPQQFPNAGAAALAACGSQRLIAAQLGVARQLVGRWLSGRGMPPTATRERIRDLFGIAEARWDQAVEAAPPPVPDGTEHPEAARARLLAQAARLRAAREAPETTARARIELERLELRVSSELARIDGTTLTEAEITRSPAWAALEARIVAALDPHPLALFDVHAAVASGAPPEHGSQVRAKHPELVAAVEGANRALLEALAGDRSERKAS
jgi:transcriptional regulator with XRE-family HTH domain